MIPVTEVDWVQV